MHFPIIELKDHRVAKDERMSDYELYDDSCVNYNTDYVGDEYTEKQREEYLKGGSLQDLLKGIARVTSDGHIKFLDADTIRATIKEQMKEQLNLLMARLSDDVSPAKPNDLMFEGQLWRGHEELFHYESCAHTSGNLVSDAVWYAGKSLYVGAIFDAHI